MSLKVGFLSGVFWENTGSARLVSKFTELLSKHKDIEELKILTASCGNLAPPSEHFGSKVYNVKGLFNQSMGRFEFKWKSMKGPPFSLLEAAASRIEYVCKSQLYDRFFSDMDVLHAEYSLDGILAQKCKKRYCIPFVLVREQISRYLTSYNLEKFLTKHLDYDILVSFGRYMAEEYFLKWGIEPEKIKVIYNGIDTTEFKPEKKPSIDVRTKHGIGADDFVLFSIKVLTKSNTMSLANSLSAFSIFSKKHSDAKYIISGGGEGRLYLEMLSTKLGISKNVIFVDKLTDEELVNYYNSSDATVHFFTYEATTSSSVLESLACGTPVIATRSGEIPYMVNTNCAIVCDQNIIGLTRAMEDMYHLGQSKRRAMGKTARRLAEKKYGMKTMVKNYIDLYKSLCGRR